MKICIAFLSFSKDVFAGIENSIYNLCLGFLANGIEVLIYTGYLAGNEKNIDAIKIYRSVLLPQKLPSGNDHGDAAIFKDLVKNRSRIQQEFHHLVREENVDYVISCDALWGILQVSEAWKNSPCPIILSLHVLNTPSLLEQADNISYLFRRTVSPILKDQIQAIYPLKELIVIPNSIDVNHFRPLNNVGSESKIIFCNARINPDKGILYLIQAFSRFNKKFNDYELWLCDGDFPFGDKQVALKQIRKEIDLLDISNSVRFLPNLSWSQIPNIIRQSFAVVLPTMYESFGRAAIETLACGVPLITTKTGNLPNLVGNSAILVEKKNPSQIYNALTFLRNNPDKYTLLSEQGPQVAENYHNPIIAKRFMNAIQDHISGYN